MKLFLGNVKIVVDKPEQSSYLLINETENNNQPEDKMNMTQATRENYDVTVYDGGEISEEEIEVTFANEI